MYMFKLHFVVNISCMDIEISVCEKEGGRGGGRGGIEEMGKGTRGEEGRGMLNCHSFSFPGKPLVCTMSNVHVHVVFLFIHIL